MNDGTHNFEELLLDAHLDQVDDQQRETLKSQMARDPELQAKNKRLVRVLRPLDLYTATPAPTNLIEKVLKRVSQSTNAEPAKMSPAREGRGYSRPFISLRELAAVAACLVLLMGALIPTLSKVRQQSHRVWCEGNLGSIYRGLSAYQGDYDGSLPYRGQLVPTAWMPGTDGSQFASNSRHAYTLVKNGYVGNSRAFLCPADAKGKPMDAQAMNEADDFADDAISYDSLNLAAGNPNVRPISAIAYMGDANPLFNDGQFDDSIDPHSANSRIHQKAGQNVLGLDGSATFLKSPVFGDQQDNVWMAGSIRKYTGSETPTQDNDAQLVPGFSKSKGNPKPSN